MSFIQNILYFFSFIKFYSVDFGFVQQFWKAIQYILKAVCILISFLIIFLKMGIGFVSNLIVFPPSFLIIFMFRKSRPRKLRESRIDKAIDKTVQGNNVIKIIYKNFTVLDNTIIELIFLLNLVTFDRTID